MIIFSYFSPKPYVVTPHLNRLAVCNGTPLTVEKISPLAGFQRGHNICFYAEYTKIIPDYHQILPLA